MELYDNWLMRRWFFSRTGFPSLCRPEIKTMSFIDILDDSDRDRVLKVEARVRTTIFGHSGADDGHVSYHQESENP